jgi:hypothetical protein
MKLLWSHRALQLASFGRYQWVVIEGAEKYLRETWPLITQALKEQGIKAELDLVSLFWIWKSFLFLVSSS